MSVYQGTYYSRTLILKDGSGNTLNITGWKLKCEFRTAVDDATILATLTTDAGGLPIVDGPGGTISLIITAAQSALLPVGKLVWDILRTDPVAGPVWLFGGSVSAKQPVTR